MDLLQRELERKKQTLAKAKLQGSGGSKRKKYLRNADIRRVEEEEEETEIRERGTSSKRAKASQHEESPVAKTETSSNSSKSKKMGGTPSSSKSKHQSSLEDLSATNITKQLRELGLPIRYFGETHNERIERLKEALEKQTNMLAGMSEMEEFRLGKGHGIRNPFLGRDEGAGQDQQQKETKKKAQKKEKEEDDNGDTDEDDPPKQIYKFLKGLLKEWEQDLTERPDIVARSVAGRNESKTLKQCKDYIRPLFKLCKSRKLEPALQAHLIKIVNYSKEGEFVKAHNAYVDVAIGRAAWPIGVTMVGIHARSGREKIGSSNVAHVMNSELQRKYLTSVKRLLTFAQKKRPDVDPSKKVT